MDSFPVHDVENVNATGIPLEVDQITDQLVRAEQVGAIRVALDGSHSNT